ncbi:T9SS type A sorting domain-containing protein [bacterium BMS3Abin03]|nr:T9SS type A sorting domain-containing protein [bacterium BMS3Abin03]MCG6960657.1 T9SS type A sorting domain-containing protein [bacterium BMS3Abin03]
MKLISVHYYNLLAKEIYSSLGNEFETLVNGNHFSSGVYFYRMQASDFIQTKKMILLK